MKLTVQPARRPLRGEVSLPGDKSLAHRAALLAACAAGESVVENFPLSGVTRPMLNALTALGVDWRLAEGRLTVASPGLARWRPPAGPIDCGNSATTMRLLAGALAAAGVAAVLDGSAGLRRRPMDRVVEPLRRLGVVIEAAPAGCAPLRLAARPPGRRLRGAEIVLPVASAQVKSCLLLAGLAAEAPVAITEPGPSRDHTERLLRGLGLRVATDGGSRSVRLHPPAGPLPPLRMRLPGDFSSAAFLIVAALIVEGSDVLIRGTGLNPTRTGLLDVLREMGGAPTVANRREEGGEPAGDLRVRAAPLRAAKVGGELVVRMIDEFPAFAAAAARAAGRTEVRDAAELRHKESDRVSALCEEMRRLGVAVEELPDGFVVQGGPVAGGTASARGDHRLAMSLALTGLAARDAVTVEGAEVIGESFPDFPAVLARLGADVVPPPVPPAAQEGN